MAASPVYGTTPRIGKVLLDAADTAKKAPSTNVFTVFTAGSAGSVIERVYLTLNGSTGAASTANVLRLWINDGSSTFLFCETAFAVTTPSASVVGASAIVVTPGLYLPTGYSLKATIHVHASAVDDYTAIALGADL